VDDGSAVKKIPRALALPLCLGPLCSTTAAYNFFSSATSKLPGRVKVRQSY
jgi:hypothetical protein